MVFALSNRRARATLAGILVLGALWACRPKSSDPEKPPPRVILTGQFERGALLAHVLRSAALSPTEAERVTATLTKILNPRSVRAGDRYEIITSTDGRFHSLAVIRNLTRFIVESTPGNLLPRIEPVALVEEEKSTAGELKGSLWLSLKGAGMNPKVIAAVADVFAWSIDFFADPRAGDKFAFRWRESRTSDGALADVTILSAIYQGKLTGRRTALYFAGEHYEYDGSSLRKAFLHAPLSYQRISSGFQWKRMDPIDKVWKTHPGIDYAAPPGTPVVAVGDGMVISRGWAGNLGNYIKIRHNTVYTTGYGHLLGYARGLAVGQRVKQGQVIGFVGQTGHATGPHLHFAMIKDGSLVNFLRLTFPATTKVPAARWKAFVDMRDKKLKPLEDILQQSPAATS